jgi:hypothetical protein
VAVLLAGGPGHAAFEVIGLGAQTKALGGAFVAGVDSDQAVWFNPAGGASLGHWQAGTTHGVLHPGLDDLLSLHGLTAAGPVRDGTLLFGVSLLSADGWQEDVTALGYGRRVHARLALGATLRSSAWRADRLSRRSWSLDAGAMWDAGYVHPEAFLRLGLLLTDLNGPNQAAGGQAAGEASRGIAVAAAVHMADRRLLVDIERKYGETEVRAGYEARVAGLAGARFRGGGIVGPGSQVAEVDVGLGQDWREWHVDYAFTYPLQLSALGGMHRLSVKYEWR